jgi:hypothetical protein
MSFSTASTLVQLAFVGITLLLALIRPEAGISMGRRLGQWATSFLRPWMAALLCGLTAFMGSAAFGLLVRFPQPQVHDEFSYLLAGDTYASGRLTNPTPPFPEHFETFHVLQTPTYASKYPPGQGLMLALGDLLGGHPIVGVWLGTAIACALIFWMLQAFVPFRWALLGGLLAAFHLGFFSHWSQSFWGGSLAAAGGALLLGGFRRMASRPDPAHGIPIALGLTILAITRPFEGLLLSLPLAILLLGWTLKRIHGPAPRTVALTCIVAACVLTPFGLGLAHHNKAVTGRYCQMPYVEYERQHGAVPVFLWAGVRELPDYSDDVFRRFQTEWALPEYEKKRTLRGYLLTKPWETLESLTHILPVALLLPVLLMAWFKGERWDRIALICVGVLVLSLLGTTFPGSRKLAPATGGLMILAVQGLRRLRLWEPTGRPVGRSLARGLVLAIPIATLTVGFAPAGTPAPPSMPRYRAAILENLESTGERHLVFVRYSPYHNVHEEWVYNRADLEGSQVIWARYRSPSENRRLSDYFEGRKVWLLEPDDPPPTLQVYQPSASG